MKKVCRSLVAVPLFFVMTAAAFAGQVGMPAPTDPAADPPPACDTSGQTSTPAPTDTTGDDAATLAALALNIYQSLPSPF